jgi:hypothetical protein
MYEPANMRDRLELAGLTPKVIEWSGFRTVQNYQNTEWSLQKLMDEILSHLNELSTRMETNSITIQLTFDPTSGSRLSVHADANTNG